MKKAQKLVRKYNNPRNNSNVSRKTMRRDEEKAWELWEKIKNLGLDVYGPQ